MKTNTFKARIRSIFACFLALAIVMVGRLYVLQVMRGKSYTEKADEQYVDISVDTFDRGTIFFQDKLGNLISAATLKSGYLLAINPEKIGTSSELYYQKLSAIIPLDATTFYAKASMPDDSYEEIADELSDSQMKQLTALDLPALIIQQEKWRYYPGGSLAAQTIGFVGYDSSGKNLVGRYGLEEYYNDILQRDDSDASVNIFAQLFSNIGNTMLTNQNSEGDIVTTIDPEIQAYLEQVMQATNEQWGSQFSGGIVMNPYTGEIYAMAYYPTFNLNDAAEQTDVSIYANPNVSDAYEMGSIVKPLTIAAALDAGAITASTTYDDTASITVDGSVIHNFDDQGRGIIPIQIILNDSLNVGASFVATKMGKPTMFKYFKAYGLGVPTGIDLPDEASGDISNLVDNLNNNEQVEYDTASFGQGISMTPIQTIRALAVLANGGKLVTPHVVDQINYITGATQSISNDTADEPQVITPATSKEITQMLVNVVDQALDGIVNSGFVQGGSIVMNDYNIAAKTGTAEIARPASQGGGYIPGEYLHSFFGYFPAFDPKFIILLYTYEPQDVDYADQTLTQPFFDMVRFLITYYNIPPDR